LACYIPPHLLKFYTYILVDEWVGHFRLGLRQKLFCLVCKSFCCETKVDMLLHLTKYHRLPLAEPAGCESLKPFSRADSHGARGRVFSRQPDHPTQHTPPAPEPPSRERRRRQAVQAALFSPKNLGEEGRKT